MFLTNIKCDTSRIRGMKQPTCVKKYGWWKWVMLVQKDWSLTADQIVELQTSLSAALINDDYDARIWMIGQFHTVELQYQDQSTQNRGDGSTEITRESVAGWQGTFSNGGMCYSKAVSSVTDLQDTFNIVIGTSNNSLIGTKLWNETTEDWEFTGMDLSMLNVPTPMVGDPTETDRYMFQWQLADKDQLFVDGWVIDVTGNLFKTLPGITDVTLTEQTAINGTGVVTIGAAAGCGSTNLATSSASATWANVARWEVTNWQTGAAITKTSVAVAAGGAGFTLDLDHTDPDYPASGDYLGIRLADVSALAGAGLEYYESFAENPALQVSGRELLIKIP